MRARRSPVQYVILVLLALATGVLVWMADRHVRQAPQVVAHGVPVASAALSPTGTPTPIQEQPVAVFLGDAYTAGTDGKSWADLVVAAKGWREVNLAAPGMGFKAVADTCEKKPCTALGGQLDRVVEHKPAYVFVMAGAADGQALQAAQVTTFVQKLRSALPDATIYLVNPVVSDARPPGWVGATSDALKAAAKANKATYVDVGQPLAGHPELVGQSGQPTPTGHQAIADGVLEALG